MFAKLKIDKKGKILTITVKNFVRKGMLNGKDTPFNFFELSKFVQFKKVSKVFFEKKVTY